MNTTPLIAAVRRSAQGTRASTLSRTLCPHEAARVRIGRPQARWIGDLGGKPPRPPGIPEPSKVFAPKTRLAVGVVFVGTLIYSMVSTPTNKTSRVFNS